MKSADQQRSHFESGIFRRKIDAAFFDSRRAHMEFNASLREAIGAGVLSLLMNRGAELRGLRDKDLREIAWRRIESGATAIQSLENFEQQRRHIVAVVTRVLADVAVEFWQRSECVTSR